MAWRWSHTAEAYAAARDNLQELPREVLEVIFAEWRAAQDAHGNVIGGEAFSERKYARALRHAKTLPDDVLADFIWERAESQALCENGGHAAWLCPYGCGPHTVSFSQPEPPDAGGCGLPGRSYVDINQTTEFA